MNDLRSGGDNGTGSCSGQHSATVVVTVVTNGNSSDGSDSGELWQ